MTGFELTLFHFEIQMHAICNYVFGNDLDEECDHGKECTHDHSHEHRYVIFFSFFNEMLVLCQTQH